MGSAICSTLCSQQPAALALPAAFLFRLALVVQFLAARQRKLDFGATFVVKIELERDESHSLALNRSDELADLPPVQEQLTQALGGIIEAAPLEVFGDVGIDEPDLPPTRIGIGFCNCRLPLAQGFYFRSGQRNAGLERLTDRVVEPCLAIVRDDAGIAFGFPLHRATLHSCGARRSTDSFPFRFQKVANLGEQLLLFA